MLDEYGVVCKTCSKVGCIDCDVYIEWCEGQEKDCCTITKNIPAFDDRDIYAPIVYLLYLKGVITEDTLNLYAESFSGNETQKDYIDRIQSIFH